MTNQEQLAREWAEGYQKNYPEFLPESHATEMVKRAKAAADYIMEHTTPPTMADVEWDDAEHFGQGAVGEDGVEWVMLYLRRDGMIVGIKHDLAVVRGLRPEWLTPNGKRYELVDITDKPEPGPEHPKTLRTVEDYGNAPVGTIAAINGYDPIIKGNDGWGRTSEGENTSEETARLAVAERKILRWGWNW